MQRSLSDWLAWQETLHPAEIELGLDRVHELTARLALRRPKRAVVTVGGSNGKGSTVRFLEELCAAGDLTTAVYTSPHLVRYNERMRINRCEVTDEWLVEQFERVDIAREDVSLTYFEFGTLAALRGFSAADVDVWILEVGLGGRLDAVNVVDPDVSLVTTVSLEHQQWLGDTIDEIAVEKAGILRAGRPACFGDEPVPDGFLTAAGQIGARLSLFGREFGCRRPAPGYWDWFGRETELPGLTANADLDSAQCRNISLALAAAEHVAPELLTKTLVERALSAPLPPGRFQRLERDHQWIVDVAHNPQAAQVLRDRLQQLGDEPDLTIVVGLLDDKQVEGFVACFADLAQRWLVCSVEHDRGRDSAELAAAIEQAGGRQVSVAGPVEQALEQAEAGTPSGQRILVTGSFMIAGPALSWLGLY